MAEHSKVGGGKSAHQQRATLLLDSLPKIAHPTPRGVGCAIVHPVKEEHKTAALNRLKTVRGHVEAVIGMVDGERYCPDIMKQVSAVQGSLEKVNRILLQNHVETCVLEHVQAGRSEQVVDELMETLRYTPGVTGVDHTQEVA